MIRLSHLYRSSRGPSGASSRFFLDDSVHRRFLSSVWSYPQSVWGRNDPKKSEKSKVMMAMEKKQGKLESLVQRLVRLTLEKAFPDAFVDSAPMRTKIISPSDPAFRTLMDLNGYESLKLPDSTDVLPLAEGVVAMPGFYSRWASSRDKQEYFLWTQTMDEYAYPSASQVRKYRHKLVEDDITIYRILESRADNLLTSIQSWISSRTFRVEQALNSLVGKRVDLTGHAVGDEVVLSEATDGAAVLKSMLVFGSNDLVLYTDMSDEICMLTLPYSLGHKGASTLLSVSLVVFGALPLAYRSLKFASVYPGLSEVIAASVVGTVSYGIYSSRWAARTSQSHMISRALCERVYARDDAIRLVLRDAAVHRVSRLVMAVYQQNLVTTSKPMPTTHAKQFRLPISLLDPNKLALEFGIVKEDDEHGETIVSLSLDEAIERLESKAVQEMEGGCEDTK